MDDINRVPPDASDEEMAAAENAASQAVAEERQVIKLTCPVCQTQKFELIRIRPGRYQLFWKKPGRASKVEAKMQRLIGRRRVEAYRCRHCDYIMMFARSD
jgi:hypothetical protein